MSQPSAKSSAIVNHLAKFVSKVLKPGGASVGGMSGLWAFWVQ
ncbi:MAG: hypothetical protein AAGE59_00470 [Cyanobacteria bacterium P01_F01_bin.86]